MKKIVVFIITILILGILAMITCIQNSKRIEKEKMSTTSNEVIDNYIKENNNIQDCNVENKEEQKVDEMVEKNETIQQETKIELSENKVINNSQSLMKNTETKNNVETQKINTNTQQANNENTNIKDEESAKDQEEISQTMQAEDKIITEEFKRNDEMIEKIKSVIQNNATEDMQNYGYEIVVDSSIKELTNQFTYTENRVKQKITWKYGTIRIYAEDYYCNGQYVMTECYII